MKKRFFPLIAVTSVVSQASGSFEGKRQQTNTTTKTFTGTEWFHSDSPINRGRFQTGRRNGNNNRGSPKWFCYHRSGLEECVNISFHSVSEARHVQLHRLDMLISVWRCLVSFFCSVLNYTQFIPALCNVSIQLAFNSPEWQKSWTILETTWWWRHKGPKYCSYLSYLC